MDNSIKIAVSNIAAFGDTDIFPFSFEKHIFSDKPELMISALKELHLDFDARLSTTPPDNINTLAPVGYTGFRWATQIDPLWNAYYLALVIEMGAEIEKARIPVSQESVFSYRFVSENPSGGIFDDQINWKAYMDKSLELSKIHPYVITCDVSDFYSRIYHHRIENSLKWTKSKSDTVRRIVEVMKVFSRTVSYGLPVGGPASRLLAELSLNNVDKMLRSEGVTFCRFVDDYKIFCKSKDQAYEYLIYISDKLFNEGLSLQKTKTRILSSKEFNDEGALLLRAHQATEADLSEEEKLLRLSIRFDPYSETRFDDYEELKEQVSNVDIASIIAKELDKSQIDTPVVRQAISVLRVVEEGVRKKIIASLLEYKNIHNLAPVFTRLMTVLRGIYVELDPETQDVIDSALIQLIDSDSYIVKVDLNLAYVVQVLRKQNTEVKERLFARLYRENQTPLVRREIILAMADWGHNHWLSDIKKQFNGMSTWERRAFIIASYRLADEGKHWREHNTPSFSPLEIVVRTWFRDRLPTNQSIP